MKIGSLDKYLNVAIPIIKNKDGAVLIVKRKDPIESADGVFHWHFPGAVVDSEHDYPEVENFVVRETGYRIRPLKKISDRSNHPLGHKNIYVEFELFSDEPEVESADREIVEEHAWVKPQDLYN